MAQQINPTLCTVHNPKLRLKGTWIVEPKIDGMRLIVIVKDGEGRGYSRKGNYQPNLQVFADLVAKLYDYDCMVDGEIYSRDLGSTIGSVRSKMTTEDRLRRLHYHQFDILTRSEVDSRKSAPIEERKQRLVSSTQCPLIPWEMVPGCKIGGHLRRALSWGYEGIVIKEYGSRYCYNRSKTWRKYKPSRKHDHPCIAAVKKYNT